MVKNLGEIKDSDYEHLRDAITYLLAGLEGATDGHKINGIAVQQTGVSDFRVVLRAQERDATGLGVHVISFTNASEPAVALLRAERGYRENVVRWTVDRFAEGVGDNGNPEIKQARLHLTD